MSELRQPEPCRQNRFQNEKGVALIVYLFVLAAMSALAVAALQVTNLGFQASQSYKKSKQAFYSAEVGLDLAVNTIVKEFEDLTPYTESENYPGADAEGFITENYRDHSVKYRVTNPLEKFLYQSSVGNSFIFHYAHTYDIEATATSLKDSSRESLKERIRILETPLVQYFVFFGQTGGGADLELFPGPLMNMWGRIHSNGDIYIGSSGTGQEGEFSTINLRNYDDQGNQSPHLLSASGKITTRTKHDGTAYDGTVFIKTSSTGTSFSPAQPLPPLIDKSNEAEQEARFNDYVLVNEPPFVTPSRDLIKRGGFYEERAKNPGRKTIDGITITGTGGLGPGNIEVSVSRPASTNVTDLVRTGRTTSGGSVAGLPFPIIQETRNAFGDCRERDRHVDTTDIDLNALQRWYVAYLADLGLSLAGDGILIYASRSTGAGFTNQSGNLQAIRLVEIDRLDGVPPYRSSPQLLDETTLATDNPLYVQGDFNSINTKGAALVSDAFNILSNNFRNHQARAVARHWRHSGWHRLPPRGGKTCGRGISSGWLAWYFRGTETTVNTAVFAGNVHERTTDGDGVHVYPRFHEFWWDPGPPAWPPRKTSNLHILGSFVNLWASEQAKTEWCPAGGDCYSAPTRNWGWDVRFQDPDFWPPFIPSVFSVERGGFLEK